MRVYVSLAEQSAHRYDYVPALCADLIQAIQDARAIQTKFLESRGLTWEQARALDEQQRTALQDEYAPWLLQQGAA